MSDINAQHVLRVISPIWKTKTEPASRVRGCIQQVLDWATAHGHRKDADPARWRGQLEYILANPKKIAPVRHLAAIPFTSMRTVYLTISAVQGQSARALRFLILTAARSGEVRGMLWSEVDRKACIWTIPASRMKAKRDHRVPL